MTPPNRKCAVVNKDIIEPQARCPAWLAERKIIFFSRIRGIYICLADKGFVRNDFRCVGNDTISVLVSLRFWHIVIKPLTKG